MVFSGLDLKLVATVSPTFVLKSVARVSQFGPQNRQLRFGDLCLKITATIFWFGSQNQVGDGLPVAPQNRWEDEDGAGHMSRSSGMLWLEVSRARVSQSGLKTGEAAAWVVHVAPSWRSCGSEAEDEQVDVTCCVGPYYPYFVVFIVLCHMINVVF
jgi:hypothetical protein